MRLRLALFGLVLMLLVGCGGGGGNSGPSLLFSTDWTHAGQTGPDGASLRVRLLKLDDTDAVIPLLLVKTSSKHAVKLTGFPAGTYRLRVELRSNVDGTGTINGVVEEILTITSGLTVQSAVGTAPAAIDVTPGNVAVIIPGSARFSATAFDSNGHAAFVDPTAFGWSVTGPASVSSDGIVTPSGAGSGTATATLAAFSAQGDYASTTSTPTTTKWTVLVYMNAANNLDQFSNTNVNQMELIADNPDVRFVIQWKEAESLDDNATFNSTKRYLVKPDQTSLIKSQMIADMGNSVDMGDKQTLRDFIAWGKANYPATRYCVVVWNHGNGWKANPNVFESRGVSYDDETGNHIDTTDLPYALGPDKLDIVAWDSSLMQMMEVAYEVKDQAAYVVGSEESPPGQGYPYHTVFKPMHDNPDGTTADLTKGFIDGMLAAYPSQKITQSSIDTSKLPALASALDALGSELILNSALYPTVIQAARNTAQSYSPVPGRVYRDLYDLCAKISAGAGVPPATITACQNVQTAISDSLVWEGHSLQSLNSHGLSIDFSSATQFPSGSAEYLGLSLAIDTHWDDWLAVAP